MSLESFAGSETGQEHVSQARERTPEAVVQKREAAALDVGAVFTSTLLNSSGIRAADALGDARGDSQERMKTKGWLSSQLDQLVGAQDSDEQEGKKSLTSKFTFGARKWTTYARERAATNDVKVAESLKSDAGSASEVRTDAARAIRGMRSEKREAGSARAKLREAFEREKGELGIDAKAEAAMNAQGGYAAFEVTFRSMKDLHGELGVLREQIRTASGEECSRLEKLLADKEGEFVRRTGEMNRMVSLGNIADTHAVDTETLAGKGEASELLALGEQQLVELKRVSDAAALELATAEKLLADRGIQAAMDEHGDRIRAIDAHIATVLASGNAAIPARVESTFRHIQEARGGTIAPEKAAALRMIIEKRLRAQMKQPMDDAMGTGKEYRDALGTSGRAWGAALDTVTTTMFVAGAASGIHALANIADTLKGTAVKGLLGALEKVTGIGDPSRLAAIQATIAQTMHISEESCMRLPLEKIVKILGDPQVRDILKDVVGG